ncbi:MAG TPA: hypothetical protein VMM76_14340 [Pirellulaceae bacterium]|nr:hypothetical protein [Pirellulaceae bacterium]
MAQRMFCCRTVIVGMALVTMAGIARNGQATDPWQYQNMNLPTLQLPKPPIQYVQTPKGIGVTPQLSRPVVAVNAQPVQPTSVAISAEFVLINNTREWLFLFIDGQRSVSVPPGDRGVTLVRTGFHRFRAETRDGRFVERSGVIEANGQSWTVSAE